VEVNQICKVDHLKEMVLEASNRLRMQTFSDHGDDQDSIACMLKILAPSGYHQDHDIAEALGFEFDENLANEWDWDSFREEIHYLKSRLIGDLHASFQLPDGLFFSFGYDQEGNFGLVLRREGKDKGKRLGGSNHILLSTSKEKAIAEGGSLSWTTAQKGVINKDPQGFFF
jgi:hypothetical protein